MKNERLAYAIGKINDDLIYGAVNDTKKKHGRYSWIAAAACVCLAVGAAAVLWISGGKKTVQEQLLAATKTGGDMDAAAVETMIPVEGRIAVYEQIYAGKSTGSGIDGPESSDSTENLRPFVGEKYMHDDGNVWYRVKGMDEIKYLISEDAAGTLRLWEYRSFLVMDGILAGARGNEATDDELAEIEGNIREQFPDANLTPYTYGDVYRIIYNVESADDIVGITAAPSRSNNTDFGRQIQKRVGTHTYDDRNTVQLFFDITVNVACNGATGWDSYYSEGDKYTYSFSTDADDKLTSGEGTWATRYLTVTLRSGTTIDSWKYTALSGRFYEFGGIFTKPLEEDTVYAINSIFGIE